MSTVVVDAVRADAPTLTSAPSAIRIALLGVGQVGGAVAAFLRTGPLARRFTITSGLVRDVTRERPSAAHVSLTSDPIVTFHDRPDIVIEALGGLEPARTLVLSAIERGIPVVTANKSLLAAHGAELLAAADRQGVPLRYEAAVVAGVPFLGTFSRRPLARAIAELSGIVNGTTNYILSRMSDGQTVFAVALAEAQRCGYAEPDPSSDINGTDAAEKLCVLIRHFRQGSVSPRQIEPSGIDTISRGDLEAAREFGGVLKPIVHAEWHDDECSAFAGPAFVPNSHPLSRVDGVQNAVLLRNRSHGELFFAGPGAGPSVTAATLLDDATEIADECHPRPDATGRIRSAQMGGRTAELAVSESQPLRVQPARTGWFVRLPGVVGQHSCLASFGVELKRASQVASGHHSVVLTHPCDRDQITRALRKFEGRTGCRASAFRALAEQ
ncbi:MAG: homoserine dehydrogenase [Vicinamibacterales bacterium]